MKYFLLLGLLWASPLQGQLVGDMTPSEWAVVSQYCWIGPPVTCQIHADSVLTPITVRELEIMVLSVALNTPHRINEADSMIYEIIWRVEFMAEINAKYGGDNTSLTSLINRLYRIKEHVRNEQAFVGPEQKLWMRKWHHKSDDLSQSSSLLA